jgi:hypothetical protein
MSRFGPRISAFAGRRRKSRGEQEHSAMSRRLTIIQGHPDPAGNRLCHALADAYAGGAANVATL